MPKPIHGSAGRLRQREEQREQYGVRLATMLIQQARYTPTARVLHLGSPGAIQFVQDVAPQLYNGELLLIVYTYDELEEARAALAGLGNVQVINEINDIDPDEPPFDLVTCIIPYQMRRPDIELLLDAGLRLLASTGTFYLAGDRHHDWERTTDWLTAQGMELTPLIQNGQFRIATAGKPVRGGLRQRR